MDLHSSTINPMNVAQEQSPIQSIRSYLKHHYDKLALVKGGLEYALQLVDDLDEVNVDNDEDQQRINAIQTGLRETLKPAEKIVNSLTSIHQSIDELLMHVEGNKQEQKNN